MNDPILIRDWNVDAFHRRVLQLEAEGYVTRRETYKIVADTDPETGEVMHLHTIELFPPPTANPVRNRAAKGWLSS